MTEPLELSYSKRLNLASLVARDISEVTAEVQVARFFCDGKDSITLDMWSEKHECQVNVQLSGHGLIDMLEAAIQDVRQKSEAKDQKMQEALAA